MVGTQVCHSDTYLMIVHSMIYARGATLSLYLRKLVCWVHRSSPLPDLGKGWTKLKRPRPSGRTDFEYVSPSGRIFRSKK